MSACKFSYSAAVIGCIGSSIVGTAGFGEAFVFFGAGDRFRFFGAGFFSGGAFLAFSSTSATASAWLSSSEEGTFSAPVLSSSSLTAAAEDSLAAKASGFPLASWCC